MILSRHWNISERKTMVKSHPDYWNDIAKELSKEQDLVEAISASLWTAYLAGYTEGIEEVKSEIVKLCKRVDIDNLRGEL